MTRKKLIRCPVCEKDTSEYKDQLMDTLGLDKNPTEQITEEEIKKAFKDKAKTLHPDKGGSEEDFQEVKDAKEELINMLNNDEIPQSQFIEETEKKAPTFQQHQDFKHAVRNLRAQLKPGRPCSYCNRKY